MQPLVTDGVVLEMLSEKLNATQRRVKCGCITGGRQCWRWAIVGTPRCARCTGSCSCSCLQCNTRSEEVLKAAGQVEGSGVPDEASAAPEASWQSAAPSGHQVLVDIVVHREAASPGLLGEGMVQQLTENFGGRGKAKKQYHNRKKELTVQAVSPVVFGELAFDDAGQVEGSGVPDEASAAPEASRHSEEPAGHQVLGDIANHREAALPGLYGEETVQQLTKDGGGPTQAKKQNDTSECTGSQKAVVGVEAGTLAALVSESCRSTTKEDLNMQQIEDGSRDEALPASEAVVELLKNSGDNFTLDG